MNKLLRVIFLLKLSMQLYHFIRKKKAIKRNKTRRKPITFDQ
jgi:hypothetical protein